MASIWIHFSKRLQFITHSHITFPLSGNDVKTTGSLCNSEQHPPCSVTLKRFRRNFGQVLINPPWPSNSKLTFLSSSITRTSSKFKTNRRKYTSQKRGSKKLLTNPVPVLFDHPSSTSSFHQPNLGLPPFFPPHVCTYIYLKGHGSPNANFRSDVFRINIRSTARPPFSLLHGNRFLPAPSVSRNLDSRRPQPTICTAEVRCSRSFDSTKV